MKHLFFAFVVLVALSSVSLAEGPACAAKDTQIFTLDVTTKGFEPNSINTTTDKCVVLKVTRKTDSTCATEILIPDKKIKKDLPLGQAVVVEVGRLKKGEVRFGCAMDLMESGKIIVK